MSPDLKPGTRFEWRYTVPARATVPHDPARFEAKLAQKVAKAAS